MLRISLSWNSHVSHNQTNIYLSIKQNQIVKKLVLRISCAFVFIYADLIFKWKLISAIIENA